MNTCRSFGAVLAAGAALAASALALAAETPESYPNRPIRLMVGFAPGGSTDAPVRVLADLVSKALKQPVIVDNKPGVGGTMPVSALQSSPADGYTLAITSAGMYRLPYTQGIKWDPSRDLAYVIGLTGYTFGIVVPESSKIKSMADYVAQAKASPGVLSYSTPGIATTNHLTMEQISAHYGIKLNHIPYKGSAESLNALLGGQVDSAAETSAFVPFVQGAKMRLIVVWGSKRMARFPEVPTLRELGVNIVQSSPWGLVAPKGTDPKIVAKLHDAFKLAMDSPAFKEVLGRFDMEPDYRTPKDFQLFAVESMRKEKEILDALGLSQKP